MWSVLLAALLAAAAAAEPPLEAPLPAGAAQVDDPGRYRSPRSWEETLDFYRRIFNQTAGVRWRNIINQPGIKAKHVESLRKKTRWEGINIYERQGEVRIYVIARESPEKDAPAERKRSGSRP
jgi:hypothetical protein